MLNISDRDCGGRRGCDAAHRAEFEIVSKIEAFHSLFKGRRSLETSMNALETLVEIGNSITEATETIQSEVRKHFQCDTCIEDAMIEILCEMTPNEQRQMAELGYDDRDRFLDRAISVRGESAGYCMMDCLENVVEIMERVVGKRSDEETESEEFGSEIAYHEQHRMQNVWKVVGVGFGKDLTGAIAV